MSLAVAFRAIREALEQAGVSFALGGSWASTVHGEPRATNDVDVIADFTPEGLSRFLDVLSPDFYCDRSEAQESYQRGRPFNAIFLPMAFKFDFFPVRSAHGKNELHRRQTMVVPFLSTDPVPIVTAEDTVIAKLRWYRQGGEVSDRQWRDILGVIRAAGPRLDRAYVDQWTATLGLQALWQRAQADVSTQPDRR